MKFSGSYLDAKSKSVKDKSGQEFYTVTFDGSATINHAVEAANVLRDAIASEKSVIVNLAAVKQVDTSFIQLLIALGRSLIATDRQLCYDGLDTDHPFVKTVTMAGFTPSPEGVWFDSFHPAPGKRK